MERAFLKTAANYSILLLCVLCFPLGGLFDLLLPGIQLMWVMANYGWSSNLKEFLFLQLHMLLATMAGNAASGYLYLRYVSGDTESKIISILVFQLGILIVLALSLLFGTAKFIQGKRKKNKRGDCI